MLTQHPSLSALLDKGLGGQGMLQGGWCVFVKQEGEQDLKAEGDDRKAHICCHKNKELNFAILTL